MRLIILITLLLYSTYHLNAENSIVVKTSEIGKDTISNQIYGVFLEFLMDYVNGPMGFYAQELKDRGFDHDVCDEQKFERSCVWDKINNVDSQDSVFRDWGGYNRNGNYSQYLVKHDSEGETGIFQDLIISDTVLHDFYIYGKSESETSLFLYFSYAGEKLYEKEIVIDSTDWKKYSFEIPVYLHHNSRINLVIRDSGKVEIDESSLMPQNNYLGIRDEYIKLFEYFKPSNIRFPGGTFVELSSGFWRRGIGHIDQRKSPNYADKLVNQRMDFGYFEYLIFCEDIGITPFIVSSWNHHNIEEILNLLEFILGPEDSEFGSIRKDMGRSEPFKLRYFGIGNEIWHEDDYLEYAEDLSNYYDIIKNKYPQLQIIISGNHWSGESFILNQMKLLEDNIDIYTWHPTKGIGVNETVNDTINFLSILATPNYFESDISRIHNAILSSNYTNNIKVGVTEWWNNYDGSAGWTLDTADRNNSLESGLWDAAMVMGFQKNPGILEICSRTVGLAFVDRDTLKNGKKSINATPGYKAIGLLKKHNGSIPVPLEVSSDKYSIPDVEDIWPANNIDYLLATATRDIDTLYINVINRNPNESIKANITIDTKVTSEKINAYILTSDHYLNMITPGNPDAIKAISAEIELKENYTFPPHSLTILAFPVEKISSVEELTSLINISPNPVKDQLKINLPENIFVKSAKIITIQGRLVYEDNSSPLLYNQTIDVSAFSRGKYFLSIQTNEGIITKEFLKE